VSLEKVLQAMKGGKGPLMSRFMNKGKNGTGPRSFMPGMK